MAWNISNRPLTTAEQEANGALIWRFFGGELGWSANAVAAMLANMQAESTINPGRWEGGVVQATDPYNGVGLVQWTPWTKLFDWVASTYGPTHSPYDGYVQMERIKWEYNNGQQWIFVNWGPIYDDEGSLIDYQIWGMEWADWIHSDADPYYLAQVFTTCYERPAEVWQPWRWEQAGRWYQYITGQDWHGKSYWLYQWAAARNKPRAGRRKIIRL